MKKLYSLSVLLLSLVLFGCSSDINFTIDNPTAEPVVVNIDDQTYSLAPNSEQAIELAAGPHTIESPAIGKQRFMVYSIMEEGSLINPTLSDYVMVTERYFTEERLNSGHNLTTHYSKKIILDGVPFDGELDHFNDLFIDTKWRYGPREELPNEVYERDTTMDNTVRTKLFTRDDFVQYVESTENKGYFEKNRRHLKPEPYQAKNILDSMPSFDDKALAEKYQPLLALSKQYLLASTASEQKNANDALSDMSSSIFNSLDHTNRKESAAWSKVTRFNSSLYTAAIVLPQP